MTAQKYFTLGAGSAFCGSVNSRPEQQRRVIQTLLPSHPLLSLHFSWYQQTERWNTIESTGEVLWTVFHHLSEGPTKPLLRNDGFAPLFIRFDDCREPSVTEEVLIYLSKIAMPVNRQWQTLHYKYMFTFKILIKDRCICNKKCC